MRPPLPDAGRQPPDTFSSIAVDDVGEVEDGQEHADDHAADDDAEDDNQHRFDERHQAGQGVFNFFVEEVRDTFEHGVNVAGLFAGGHHADDHAGENGVFGQRLGNAFAALDVAGGGLDGLFQNRVADGLGNNLQHVQNRHAAADERRQRAGETGEADLVRDGAEDGQLDAFRVPELPAFLGFDVMQPTVDRRDGANDEQQQPVFQDVADINQSLR